MPEGTRSCGDCGADISHRARQARRCEKCALADKHRPRPPAQQRHCLGCQVDISNRHRAARRCESCADAEIRRAKAAGNVGAREHHCEQCGKAFVRQRSDTRYCRPLCRLRGIRAAELAARQQACALCLKPFQAVRSDAIYCNPKCTRRAHYLANQADRVAAAARWNRENREARRVISMSNKLRRRAAVLASPGVSVRDWRRLVRRYGGRCAYCGVLPDVLHMEHIVPLARGGRHSIGNVLPACATCNLTKWALLLIEWRARVSHASVRASLRAAATGEALTLF
jgi:hypothetical protein